MRVEGLHRTESSDVARYPRKTWEVTMRKAMMVLVLFFGFVSVSAAETVTYVLETPGVV